MFLRALLRQSRLFTASKGPCRDLCFSSIRGQLVSSSAQLNRRKTVDSFLCCLNEPEGVWLRRQRRWKVMPGRKPSDLLIVFGGRGVVSRCIIAWYSVARAKLCLSAGLHACARQRCLQGVACIHRLFCCFLFRRRGDDGRALASRLLAHSRRRYQRGTDGRTRDPWLSLTKICSLADGRVRETRRGGRGWSRAPN